MSVPKILNYPGSKWSMAEWIIEHMPPHKIYLEPYFGSGAVFFNKTPSELETINDLDENVSNLFKVIRDIPERLSAAIELTPWSRSEYLESYERTGDSVEDARRFLVRTHQAMGARVGNRSGWKRSTLSSAPQWSVFQKLPERIIKVTDRLKNTQIENRNAIELISEFSSKDTLIYADPPYVFETRIDKMSGRKMYVHEMTDQQHLELLNSIVNHPGMILLSGYDSDMYNDLLVNWRREVFESRADSGEQRVEVLWINPAAAERIEQRQLSLF